MTAEKKKILFIIFFVISIIVLMLNSAGPFEGQFRIVGFILFTVLCLGLVITNRHSKWKVVAAILYWLVFGVTQMV